MNHEHGDAVSENGDRQHAPWLAIPSRAISVVEHPCLIKNIDKGIASLGGPVKLSKGLRSKLETTTNAEGDDELKKLISVSLRPDDPFAKRLLSTPVTTSNLLLKVTVPKRTGRRRKRGSLGPFLAEGETGSTTTPYVDAAVIYMSLQDNVSTYKVALAGMVDETHRFRTMPDLQYAATHSDMMAGLRQHVLPLRYSQVKNYTLNTAAGADSTKSVGPSAEFLQMPVAFNYRFQQNTYIKYTGKGEVNLQKSLAYRGHTIIKPTAQGVPTGPKPTLPPESSLSPYLQTLIAQIRAELASRPIITRHILYNKLGWSKRYQLRQAAVYCGYFFESGPWREALVKWGLDPRKNPKYRSYQTVSFLSYLKTGTPRHFKAHDQHVQKLIHMSAKDLEDQHTFDGVTVSHTGNLFQFCDITDPLIANILDTSDIRATCAPTFQGWFHVGTWAKATVILKDKMNTIIGGGTPDDSIYRRLIEWPELWDDKEIYDTYRDEVNNREIHQEKIKEHNVMHSARWAARNPRYAFEKMEAAEQQADEAEDGDIPEDMTEDPITAEAILNEENNGSSDDEDDEDEDEGDGEDGERNENAGGAWGSDNGDDDDDDDDDGLATFSRAASEGPAPFGGLYRV
ncbi:transcription factor tfiiic complex a box associated subunit sfc1 [Dothidotthia symphoricarpi CBS 119687]|uniref:Transcription factor tfiiic complex a box associated subunit sfc1 n=1 Tax=Dothidotthia symphoricarpi CBS 119687 TaxID=1392245 RepID=A0A6A6A2Z9_9PLEO|nr:transcription factor tfiiic complex a box associated subunit sfc1 [Dothidotthia symphoricarpi CBS 119687]KAF2125524.1 transcription factor tfiiic complex a box associated subunit sfc1 [Dothidotthia symphoricarpi CBS 119687]